MTHNNNLDITKLAYEKINDKYSKAKYGEFDVIMNMTTGYINATKLCTDGGKHMKNWTRNESNKELIDVFNKKINNPVIIYDDSYGITRGTYVHHDLILVIACWISPIVFLKINNIINEWRKMSLDNEIRFRKDIGDGIKEGIGMFESSQTESVIRDKIASDENGIVEVKTEVGFIDVLTDTKIIEVKKYHNWKHAVGQVECYGYFYPNKQKWIYLFDTTEYTNDPISTDLIDEICKSKDVFVKYI
jgi:hypothetical protein